METYNHIFFNYDSVHQCELVYNSAYKYINISLYDFICMYDYIIYVVEIKKQYIQHITALENPSG